MDLFTSLQLGKEALSYAKKITDLISNKSEKKAVAQKLEKAEKAFKIAETELAINLGYEICRCTWPPQIMLEMEADEDKKGFKCPKCGKLEEIDGSLGVMGG